MKDDRIMILPTTSPHSKMCLKRMKATFEGVGNVCTANFSTGIVYITICILHEIFIFKSENFGYNLPAGTCYEIRSQGTGVLEVCFG